MKKVELYLIHFFLGHRLKRDSQIDGTQFLPFLILFDQVLISTILQIQMKLLFSKVKYKKLDCNWYSSWMFMVINFIYFWKIVTYLVRFNSCNSTSACPIKSSLPTTSLSKTYECKCIYYLPYVWRCAKSWISYEKKKNQSTTNLECNWLEWIINMGYKCFCPHRITCFLLF